MSTGLNVIRFNEFVDQLHDAIDNYYHFNPDTLMPLLMVALRKNDNLRVVDRKSEGAVVLASISLPEVVKYEWVRLDPVLCKRVKDSIAAGSDVICVEAVLDDELMGIYEIFHHYDTFTVEEEYHHRIGILYHHSDNKASEMAHRQYAAICLAESLLAVSSKFYSLQYIKISNDILVRSGLQPKRPRLEVAHTLATLLDYDGKGRVYNPFAGCAIAAAVIDAGANMYADGNANDKLFAVARLLNYGMGGSNENYAQRDSVKWTDAGRFDYVLSTYRGYVADQSAFEFCLSKCLEGTLTERGKYAGIVAPKDIFEKQSEVFAEALNRDWVEKIVLLPFGEVAVLINVAKEEEAKSKVLFYNMTHPLLRNQPVSNVLANPLYANELDLNDVKQAGFLRSVVVPEVEDRPGYEIVTVKDYVTKLERRTYSLEGMPLEKRVIASIDRSVKYDPYGFLWMQGIVKTTCRTLFSPMYHLEETALIVNSRGALEPRIFDSDQGSAFFDDGFAFASTVSDSEIEWLMTELNQSYVQRQLHPYGMNSMVPEAMTEEQILNVKLYKEIELDDEDIDSILEEALDLDSDKLQSGYVIHGKNADYTIHKFLGHGFFGYTYSAMSESKITGERKEVVLKEFYPYQFYVRDGVKAVLSDIENEYFVEEAKVKFKDEAEIMRKLGNVPDSHIVPAMELFDCDETDTMYYVMPFYDDGSFQDLLDTFYDFSEEMVLNHVVKPICKALHIAHSEKVLHLDIKPENILVDDNGDGVLIDFGVAKQYDREGDLIDPRGAHSASMFAAPELKHGNMVRFGAQTDIYGLAASIYYLMTAPCEPHPVFDFSDQDEDLRANLADAGCSGQFIDAVVSGLQFSATSRPATAQDFLNRFPGCKDIIL